MSDYEAAAYLLRAPTIRERLEDAVTWPIAGPGGWNGINWEEVAEVAKTFSDGELVLVNVAGALFSARNTTIVGSYEKHGATVTNMLKWLDDETFRRVLDAIAIKKGPPFDVLGGKVYMGRRLVIPGYDNSSGGAIVWVILPDGSATELTLHTQTGAYTQGPKSDGHEWGYEGSGAAQLALDILWDVAQTEPSGALFQAFKRERIATLEGDSWAITEASVRAWLGEALAAIGDEAIVAVEG